ncbi:MAG: hypothetical protein PHR77_11525 [Kiritimatiellae bacterium]|nr:hypothetical protein [Kiritimatiellia bacterium]MDD5519920.1 hypothetical protein [Kiritimatiellia bacterium]
MKRTVIFTLSLLCVRLFAAEEIKRPGEDIALGKPYKLDPRPTYSYCTDPDDKAQLTDGQYSKGYFWTQKSTVGWQSCGSAVITIDLGSIQPLCGASFNTAAGIAGVEWPLGISILTSDDGKKFFFAGELIDLDAVHGAPPREKYAVYRYWTGDLKIHGRYVMFLVAPGGPYTFVDEIEIYRGSPELLNVPFKGEGITDAGAYRRHLAIVRRLKDDLRGIREADVEGKLINEVQAIGREISKIPMQQLENFRAVLPLNDLHEQIFRIQAALWRVRGVDQLTVWRANPWDPLSLTNLPPHDADSRLQVVMMQNECRSAALNIANAGEKAVNLQLTITGEPPVSGQRWISVHEVAWTDTKSGKPVAAALPEAKQEDGKYSINVPAGMTRQVWFSINSAGIKPGRYKPLFTLKTDKFRKKIRMVLEVSRIRFPDKPKLSVGGWDYTDTDEHYAITRQNMDAVIAHLRERFVDSPWATSGVIPANRNTASFDRWLSRWRGAQQYCIFASVGEGFDGTKIGTPEFDQKVGDWIRFWADHAVKRGLKPGQINLLLVDEPHDAKAEAVIIPWARAIRAANTGVKIWEDPTYNDPSKANPDMMQLCDVLCPNRPMMLSGGESFRDYYMQLRNKSGKTLAYYSCSGPVRLLDPYSYHRLQAWTCWQQGAGSSFFWAFGDSGGGSSWNEYEMRGGAAYTPLFLDDTSVTAGKHMEAIRESVEDYEYLVMLQSKVSSLKNGKDSSSSVVLAQRLLNEAADRVLNAPDAGKIHWNDPKDRGIADAIRIQILEMLEQLESLK